MRKAGFIMLVLLLFGVTMAVSAEDFAFSNPFEYQVFTETTVLEMGGVADIQVGDLEISESMAVSVESIQSENFHDMALTTWTGSVGAYILFEHGKQFVHPAVLGIC